MKTTTRGKLRRALALAAIVLFTLLALGSPWLAAALDAHGTGISPREVLVARGNNVDRSVYVEWLPGQPTCTATWYQDPAQGHARLYTMARSGRFHIEVLWDEGGEHKVPDVYCTVGR